jgi:hypothetical protein
VVVVVDMTEQEVVELVDLELEHHLLLRQEPHTP